MRTRPALVGALLAGALVAGCGGAPSLPGLPGGADEAPTAVPTPTVSPLTGLPLDGGAPTHPVYVVKVDNTRAAYPQVGVIHADVVVEELVEGGLTRLAAMYYAKAPAEIGPVRSMRATDISLVSPVRGTVIASGGAPVTIRRIRAANIPIMSEDTGQDGILLKSPARRAPYDRILDLRTIATEAEAPGAIEPLLPFGAASDLPAGEPAEAFTATFSGSASTRWGLQGRTYRRQDGLAAEGKEFRADNVLVLEAPVEDAGYLDPAGNGVPETILEGSGPATLFHAGRAVEATWHKSSPTARIGLTAADGTALRVPTGRTWIELVPEGVGGVTVTG